MKKLIKFTLTVAAVALAFAACNPNGMNDRHEEETSTHEMTTTTTDTTVHVDSAAVDTITHH